VGNELPLATQVALLKQDHDMTKRIVSNLVDAEKRREKTLGDWMWQVLPVLISLAALLTMILRGGKG